MMKLSTFIRKTIDESTDEEIHFDVGLLLKNHQVYVQQASPTRVRFTVVKR